MSKSRRETFWRFVCESWVLGFDIIVVNIIILLLLGYSFLYVEPGSASYVISVITATFSIVTLAVMTALYVMCGRLDWTH